MIRVPIFCFGPFGLYSDSCRTRPGYATEFLFAHIYIQIYNSRFCFASDCLCNFQIFGNFWPIIALSGYVFVGGGVQNVF